MKQRRRLSSFCRSRGVLRMLLTITIVPYLLFSHRSCVVAVSVDRQASIRGQQLGESNPIFDRRTTMITANDFDVTASSPHRKDSQNYDEEEFFPFPSSRDLVSCRGVPLFCKVFFPYVFLLLSAFMLIYCNKLASMFT